MLATWTIPKVLYTQQEQQKKAIFKETIGALSEAMHIGIINGTLNKNYAPATIFNNINSVKYCTNVSAQSCWTHPNDGPVSDITEAGAILYNGAIVAGFRLGADGSERFVIDWNGAQGPNLQGQDQLRLSICYDKTSVTYAANGCARISTQDYIAASNDGTAANTALYNAIFQ